MKTKIALNEKEALKKLDSIIKATKKESRKPFKNLLKKGEKHDK